MKLSFLSLMLNEKESFAGTGGHKWNCTKLEAKPNSGKTSDWLFLSSAVGEIAP